MRLVVCLEGEVAGHLDTDAAQARFTYAETWLATSGAYPLSASLPLRAQPITGANVVNFLWGLLPDNDRTLDTWARQFRVSARNPAAILAHVGEDCAGAVQFVTETRLPAILESSRRASEIEWLSDSDLEDRIQRLAQDSTAGRATAQEGQFSLAGAQSKTALYRDESRQRWGVPRGRTPTTHILKPASNDFDGFAANEHFCLALSQQLGLPAAKSTWQDIGGVPTLIVERYDRIRVGQRWHRIHQEDCSSLASIRVRSTRTKADPASPASCRCSRRRMIPSWIAIDSCEARVSSICWPRQMRMRRTFRSCMRRGASPRHAARAVLRYRQRLALP